MPAVSPPLASLDTNDPEPGAHVAAASPGREALAAGAAGPLASVRDGEPVHVVDVALDAALASWLDAMGIGRGQTLTILRRAAFGGPVHVRTGSGGEFAINATLARSILVAPDAARGRNA